MAGATATEAVAVVLDGIDQEDPWQWLAAYEVILTTDNQPNEKVLEAARLLATAFRRKAERSMSRTQ